MTNAGRIRSHVVENYFGPARQRGDETVTVRAGTILKELGLSSSLAASVCAALQTAKFLKENGLEPPHVKGPPSKQSTTTTFTFRIPRPSAAGNQSAWSAIWDLRGAGKATFAALGGGERWLLREREAFHESSPGAAVRERAGSSD